jgi:hypothetical protein
MLLTHMFGIAMEFLYRVYLMIESLEIKWAHKKRMLYTRSSLH